MLQSRRNRMRLPRSSTALVPMCTFLSVNIPSIGALWQVGDTVVSYTVVTLTWRQQPHAVSRISMMDCLALWQVASISMSSMLWKPANSSLFLAGVGIWLPWYSIALVAFHLHNICLLLSNGQMQGRTSGAYWLHAGYQEQKELMEELLLLPLLHPDIYERLSGRTRKQIVGVVKNDVNRPRAVLFEGPPGCGKTSSARLNSYLPSLERLPPI